MKAQSSGEAIELVIEPGRAAEEYWRDLWRYRELLYFLAWRDTVVRYKQTAIGITWVLLRPALTMLVFVLFRRLAGLNTTELPETIVVFGAILPWQFFSTALSEASASLVGNASLISKIYFPRLIIPCAAVLTAFVDFVITLGLLAILMVWHQLPPGWQLLALPGFVFLTAALSVGLGLLFAALNVEYRDFRYVVPFIIQFGIFVSPVAFTSNVVPPHLRPLLALNPLVGIIDGFRWSILGGRVPFNPMSATISCALTALIFVAGISYFRRMERRFADVI